VKPSEVLRSYRADIRRIVAQNHTRNPRVFGSAVNGKDTESSDVDLLVDPTSDTTLLDIARNQGQLQKLLGIPVDVLTPKALPDGLRERVLAEAVPV
jgi:predicted nucleotidyltransferase